jgi:type I restriction enzyme S subunit
VKKGFTQFAEGDIGLAKITPCFENGKAAIFQNLQNGIGAGTTELHVARPWSHEVNRRYLLITMKTASYLAKGEAQMTGTAGQKRVTRTYFEASPLPFPPLAEQQRIVAKVDELMALCDALETQGASALEAHQTMVETVLATLVSATDPADLNRQWVRLETYFDALFTTEASTDALKKTILELAVRGKLVPQDIEDEPASELLQKLRIEKSQLSKKNQQPSGSPRTSNCQWPFPVPDGWVWTKLGDLTEMITSGSRDWSKYISNAGAKFVTMGNLSRGSYELRLDKLHYVEIGDDREGTRTSLRPGDLLVSITGDVGNMALIPEEFGEAYINQHTAMIRLLPMLRGRFIPEVLRSPFAQRQFNEPQRGVKNSFRLSDVQNIDIPMPPLAEQHRIVAKVDALMALCDALKAHLGDAAQTSKHLADAVVEAAAA